MVFSNLVLVISNKFRHVLQRVAVLKVGMSETRAMLGHGPSHVLRPA